MGRRQGALLLLTTIAAVAAATCVGCKRSDSSLVIGVDAQPAVVSRIGKVHLTAKVGDKTVAEKELLPKTGETPFPFEVKLEGRETEATDVVIEAYSAGPNNTVLPNPMLIRRSHAPFVKGEPKLVRLRLESSCVTGTFGFKGPTCPAPQSCSGGRCIDPTLLPEDLESYAPDWAKNRPDVCKPPKAGPPQVIIGTGQTDYASLAPDTTMTPEKGPQGGHHLWIGVRTKNLTQMGSTVTLTAEQPGTGLKVPPTSFIFSLEPDREGMCKLYGLRLQLDNSSTPVQKFLGQPLDLTATVRDASGATADAKIHVNVSDKTIGD